LAAPRGSPATPESRAGSRREPVATAGGLDRRAFVRAGSAVLAAPLLASIDGGARPTQRVLLVAFAGGVRSREVLGTPANVPNLMRIARGGVTLTDVRAENVGHYGATLSLFTGNVEALGIRDNERGTNPTLFEYLRKDHGLAAGDVWVSSASGVQGSLFAHSVHADYGKAWAAEVVDGDGLFNAELRSLLSSLGRFKPDSAADEARLARLRAAIGRGVPGVRPKLLDGERQRRIERVILGELAGANADLTGPGAPDAKAIRVAASLLRVFRPRILCITLQSHDVAHDSFNGYVEVIRRNDAELGKLWDAVLADEELASSTAIVVVPEFGRDADLNQRNGLDHGDGSDDLHKVFVIAAGPEMKHGVVSRKPARTIDVCPTVLAMLGAKPPAHSRARALRELLG
jgi:hypothetical protein